MNSMDEATWVKGILSKRTPDAIRILMDLIEAGLKNGQCSALDVRDVRFAQPNVIGAVFKILPKVGFSHTDRRIKSTVYRKHGRRVDVWELTDRQKAERLLAIQRSLITPPPEAQQGLLF